jgi:hypothetical protein
MYRRHFDALKSVFSALPEKNYNVSVIQIVSFFYHCCRNFVTIRRI